MHYEVEVGGRVRHVQVHRAGGRFVVGVDGREWLVDAARIDGHTLSVLLAESDSVEHAFVSHEITVATDALTGQLSLTVGATPVVAALNGRRRWGRKDDSAGGTGPQRVIAPMPGKIVRVLVTPGQAVEPRQALVVVEAMKMENELRATRAGLVAEIAVREGQSVDTGALLLVVRPS